MNLYDAKTKPRGSLGRLEEIGMRIVEIRGHVPARLRAVVVVAAGDHGVVEEGVSAYPQEVTAQMIANFRTGGAAVNVLARAAGAEVVIADRGVGTPTRNMTRGPAMTATELERELAAGAELVDELGDVDVVALGEMGIGNSTSAAALTAAVLGVEPQRVCGRGTGVDDDGLARKVDAVRRALAANAGVDALQAFGGFELAFLGGVARRCAERAVVVLLDGYIASAAVLAAGVRDGLIAAHRSAEPGHALVLDALGLEPLLDLGLRLGEGSGAALALPLLHASIAILNEMATFDEAGVTDAGR
jgi:nicotinate-nucleotide--dimethylbenzimidazole phosphoribosyltransferase